MGGRWLVQAIMVPWESYRVSMALKNCFYKHRSMSMTQWIGLYFTEIDAKDKTRIVNHQKNCNVDTSHTNNPDYKEDDPVQNGSCRLLPMFGFPTMSRSFSLNKTS